MSNLAILGSWAVASIVIFLVLLWVRQLVALRKAQKRLAQRQAQFLTDIDRGFTGAIEDVWGKDGEQFDQQHEKGQPQ